MNQTISAFFSGVIFALGLGISNMTEPARVIGFLDLFGAWEPALVFVMLGAILVYAIGYKLTLKLTKPLSSSYFDLPPLSKIDRPLIMGAILFGTGWGILGYCPGPALAAIVTLKREPIVFFVSMIAAMNSFALLKRRNAKRG